jgi:hypothetical protein
MITLSPVPCNQAQFQKHKVLLLWIAFCGAMLVPGHDASAFAVGIGDSHELGFLWSGVQKKSGDQNRATCVNHLLGMVLGAISIANGQVYFRSSHAFEPLPDASWASNYRRVPRPQCTEHRLSGRCFGDCCA